MKRCAIHGQTLLQLLLHVIGETKTPGGIGNGASQRGHEDCTEESCAPADQDFLVAVTLEVSSRSVWQTACSVSLRLNAEQNSIPNFHSAASTMLSCDSPLLAFSAVLYRTVSASLHRLSPPIQSP